MYETGLNERSSSFVGALGRTGAGGLTPEEAYNWGLGTYERICCCCYCYYPGELDDLLGLLETLLLGERC